MAWTTPSAWTSLTIGLASLADGASATSTTTIANGTAKDIYIDLSLILASIAPGTGPAVEFFLLPLLHDGTTYGEIAKADDVRPITTSTSAHNAAAFGLRISPGTHVVAVVNRTGVAWAATGNSLQYRTYSPA